MPLADICDHQTLILRYKHRHELLPESINDKFILRETIATRSNDTFYVAHVRLSASVRTLFYSRPKLWNKLRTQHLKNTGSLSCFKLHLNHHFKSKYRDLETRNPSNITYPV